MSLYGYDEPENEADYELCPVCLSEKDCNAPCVVCARREQEAA